jgi:Tol biopolymer transport system component
MEGFPPYSVSWTPDSQLLLSTNQPAVALLNPATGAKTPLLAQARFPGYARSCPDGHFVFLAGAATKIEGHEFRADADGGNVQELTHGKFDQVPVCSADSKSVLYQDASSRLNEVSIEGGASQVLPNYADFSRAAVSPDGKLAAILTSRSGETRETLALVPMDFSQPVRVLGLERPPSQSSATAPLQFSHDGAGIIYPVRDGQTDNLWLQLLNGSPGKKLTDFQSEFIRDFSYSADGKQLAVIRGHGLADVVLIRDAGK